MELDPKAIYRVYSEEDPTALIGLDVRRRGELLTWFDTGRDRGQEVTAEREEGGMLVFETKNGFTYRFAPLTKELYDREVRPMVELSPEFESTEALRRFYLTQFLGVAPEEV